MNVIVSNQQHDLLLDLDIDVIKSVEGEYEAEELVEMFKDMFFARMILDATAIKEYKNPENIQKLSISLPADKIILLLPTTSETTSSLYLSRIISMGIYNFTTNLDGVKYLLDNPNSYKDVAHIQQMGEVADSVASENIKIGTKVFGIRNLTNHAGATTLIYMLKKELEDVHGKVVYAIEIGRHDFTVFDDKNMLSVESEDLSNTLSRIKDADIIFIDMNDTEDEDLCGNILYLLEPSIIMLNKLMRRNKDIFSKLRGKRIILNKCLLSNNDIAELEYETKTKYLYSIPPVDDRKRNNIFTEFLSKLGIIEKEVSKNDKDDKFLGIFKK